MVGPVPRESTVFLFYITEWAKGYYTVIDQVRRHFFSRDLAYYRSLRMKNKVFYASTKQFVFVCLKTEVDNTTYLYEHDMKGIRLMG